MAIETASFLGIRGFSAFAWGTPNGSVIFGDNQGGWWKTSWPRLGSVSQTGRSVTIDGQNLVLYQGGDPSQPAYITQVEIGGQRVLPVSATATRLVFGLPGGMTGNAPLRVVVLLPQGEVRSLEQRIQIVPPPPPPDPAITLITPLTDSGRMITAVDGIPIEIDGKNFATSVDGTATIVLTTFRRKIDTLTPLF